MSPLLPACPWQCTLFKHSLLHCIFGCGKHACSNLPTRGAGVSVMRRCRTQHKHEQITLENIRFSHFIAKHMLNHPRQAPPHPAGASRVQPLSLQVRPLQLCLFAFTGGRCVLAAARQPIAQSHCPPQQPVRFLVCLHVLYVDTPAFMPTCQPSYHQVEKTASIV